MAPDAGSSEGGGGLLAGLLAPLRLPERVVEALDSLADSAREFGPMREELMRVREQTEPLAELVARLERMNEDLATRLDSVRTWLWRWRASGRT